MQQRQLGPFTVSAISLGCMNLSHAYGAPVSAEQAERVLLAALDAGSEIAGDYAHEMVKASMMGGRQVVAHGM